MLSSSIRAALARKIWFVLLLCAAPLPLAAAPKYLGPNKCVSCHEHEKQKAWSAKDTHSKALQQLEDKNAAKYAKALGLADPYGLKGSCISCHATVFNGDANAGVSCETCHGAGSDYLEPHQQKGAYAKAVTLGMIDTRGNYKVWAKMCTDCHIVTDTKLTGAGHPSGSNFDVAASSKKIVHWEPAYDFAQLAAAARTAGGKKAPAPAPAPAPPKEEAKPTPPAAKPTPAPKPTAAAAPPTAAPARAETPVPTTAPPKREARPEPTSAPIAPAVTARVPTSAPTAAPTVPPRVTSPASAGRVSPALRPSVVIEIAATPIPPAPPTRVSAEAPAPAPPTTLSAAPPARVATRPPSKPRPKPKPKPKPKTTPAPPSVTRTPTKLPAPMEPPRRPPH